MVLEMKKISLLLFVSFVLFACSLADVDEESDFEPTYDKFVGCWVSMENVPRIRNTDVFKSFRHVGKSVSAKTCHLL